MSDAPSAEVVSGREGFGGFAGIIEVASEGGFAHDGVHCTHDRYDMQGASYLAQVLDLYLPRQHAGGMTIPLREARQKAQLSQVRLAELVDSGRSTIVKLEDGTLPLTERWAKRLAPALGCKPEDLYSGPPIPVIGYVGAGAAVFPIDDYEPGSGYDTEERPPFITGEAVAVEVRGDSLIPVAEDGWRLIYSGDQTILEDEVLNRLCVVALTDGRVLVKRIMRGSKPQHYHLVSTNAPMIEDAEVLWAARVKAIIPK